MVGSEIERIKTDIALIKNDIKYIRGFIEDDKEKFENYIKESDYYWKRVDALNGVDIRFEAFKVTDFKNHVLADRWMFGILFSFLTGVFITMLTFIFKVVHT